MREQTNDEQRLTMNQLPQGQGPYERCWEMGPEVLSDAELLAVIIRTGSQDATSLELAQKILAMDGGKGLAGLLGSSAAELTAIRGIGRVKAAQLLCAAEISRRLWRQSAKPRVVYEEPAQIADYYMEAMRPLRQEHVFAMFFDTKQNFIRDVLLSKGTVNSAVVSPREVFLEALKAGAVRVVLVHNHPSGDPEPSRADCVLTQQVKEAGEILGIYLVDHVIIGDRTYISLKERGIL